jgi:uncharacterized NAD(P)/FAD-binding protein YdhS
MHVKEAQGRGFDWRAVLDALRPETEAIWRRLSPQEQQRFERHLRGQWERHRHRSPESVDAVRDRYCNAQRLFAYAGTVREVKNASVTIAMRDGTTKEVHADWIVNCTGLAGASAMAADPLLAKLLTDGLITAAPGGLGLRTTPNLEAIGASQLPSQGLYVVGPPVRGSRFEATAVPELRVMAEQVATHLLQVSERAKAARTYPFDTPHSQ